MPSSSLPKPNIDMPRADPGNQEVNGLHRDPGHSEREVDLREREWEEKARGTWHERDDASHGKEPQPQPPEAEISRWGAQQLCRHGRYSATRLMLLPLVRGSTKQV